MLYIKVENGQPIDHPVLEENLIQAFGGIPSNYEPFNRLPPPVLKRFEVYDDAAPLYGKDGDTWKDLWPIRPMSEEEVKTLTDARRNRLKLIVAEAIETAEKDIAAADNQEFIDALNEFLTTIKAINLDNPFEVKLPPPPRLGKNGAVMKFKIGPRKEPLNAPPVDVVG